MTMSLPAGGLQLAQPLGYHSISGPSINLKKRPHLEALRTFPYLKSKKLKGGSEIPHIPIRDEHYHLSS